MTEPTIEDFRDSWACEHVRPEMAVDERREAFDRMIAAARAETLVEAAGEIRHKQHAESIRQMLVKRAAHIRAQGEEQS